VQLRSGERLWLAVPPVSYRWSLIAAHHDRLGCAGVSQTFRAMRQHYHWPGMKLDVNAYVAQCHPCQLKRLATEVASIRPQQMSDRLEHIHVGLAGLSPIHGDAPRTTKGSSFRTSLRGHAYICLMVDYFTKAAEFVAIPNTSAATVAQAVHDQWFMRYGVPAVITTDNGTKFEGAFQYLLARLDVDHVHTSVRHAQSNGAAERLVRTLKEMLTAQAVSSAGHWPSLLLTLRTEYMQRLHSTTRCSPNDLLSAIPPKLPPPAGALHWTPQVASLLSSAPVTHRDQAAQHVHHEDLVLKVRNNILDAQRRTLPFQAHRLASKRRRVGKPLKIGYLAYCVEPGGKSFKAKALGPNVVDKIAGQTVWLRTTAAVHGQHSRMSRSTFRMLRGQ
jgi:hypothetical protein